MTTPNNSKSIKKVNEQIYNLSAQHSEMLLASMMDGFLTGGKKALLPQNMPDMMIQQLQVNVHALLTEIPAEQAPLWFAVVALSGFFDGISDKGELQKTVTIESLFEKSIEIGSPRFAECCVSFGNYVLLEGMLPSLIRVNAPRPFRLPNVDRVLTTYEYYTEAWGRIVASAMPGLRENIPVWQENETIADLLTKSDKVRAGVC